MLCLFVDGALIIFGLGCLRLATVLSTVGLVALRLGCISFIVNGVLFTFGLGGLHLARVLFMFGFVKHI